MVGFLRRLRRPRLIAPTPTGKDADRAEATAAMRALSYRAQRVRQAWLGRQLTPAQKVAAAEAEIARDSSRRW